MNYSRACRSYCGAAALSAILSCSTVGALWDELARILARKRSIRGYRFIHECINVPRLYCHWQTAYISFFCKHGEPESAVALLSLPQRYADEGDECPLVPHNNSRTPSALEIAGKSDDLSVALWRELADTLPTKR